MNAKTWVLWLGIVAGAAASGFGCSANDKSGGGGLPSGGIAGTTAAGGVSGSTAGSSMLAGASGSSSAGRAPVGPAGAGGSVATNGAGSGNAGRGAAGASGAAPPGSAGAGTAPMGGAGNASGCPAAPAGAADPAVAALAAVNASRVPAGSGCIHDVLALNMSAQNHCNYYAMYMMGDMCIADPHGEVMSCAGYTGMNLGLRGMAAGYPQISSEVMAFQNNPAGAVAGWINTVWHRIPVLDPWTGDMGYGGAMRCDTIDFGRGTAPSPKDTVVVYPYDGQTGLPTLFNGANEGPTPPAPSTGWPSSSPINVYAQGIMVTEHTLTKDGDTTPIDHVWLDSTSAVDQGLKGFLKSTVFMYANKPFTANTKYHVKIVGTRTGGTLNLEWTFTTGAGNRF